MNEPTAERKKDCNAEQKAELVDQEIGCPKKIGVELVTKKLLARRLQPK